MTAIASARANAHVRKQASEIREKDDWYRTPAATTRALLAVETFPPAIWEPACGDGALAAVLADAGHTVAATDLVDRGYGEGGRDFLLEQRKLADAIVTNPPFKLADQFARHALALGIRKIALFGRLGWQEGHARMTALWHPHPPSRIWVCARRQTLWRGDDPDPKPSGGAIAFAWYVWERGHRGTQTGWLP